MRAIENVQPITLLRRAKLKQYMRMKLAKKMNKKYCMKKETVFLPIHNQSE